MFEKPAEFKPAAVADGARSYEFAGLTQMKRWGQISGEVDYKSVAEQVYLATDTGKVMKDMGLTPPATSYKSFSVMGKPFDPTKPDEYVASFKIRKAS